MIENLLKYQQEDAKLRDIEKELGKSEERKKAVEAKKYIDGASSLVNKLDDRAGELLIAYEEVKALSASLDVQKAGLEKALKGLDDEKEILALSKKAEEITAKIKTLVAKIDKLEEEITAIAREYSQIKKKYKEENEKYKENATKFNEFKASFDKSKEEIKKSLALLRELVDPALMERYDKKREGKMYPILYEVKEQGKDNCVCGYCHVELSLSDLSKVKSGEVIECSSCGRLLYRKK